MKNNTMKMLAESVVAVTLSMPMAVAAYAMLSDIREGLTLLQLAIK